MDYLEFPGVYQENRGSMNSGKLKLQSDSVVFKNMKTGKVEQLPASDVKTTKFLPRAVGHCLKLVMDDGTVHKFDGFRESDYDKLSAFMTKCYKKELEKVEMSVRGWNWGNVNFIGSSMEFEVHNKEAFEIPLNNVSHTTTAKNEVTLEFHQNDDAAVSLVEMRFHIPSEQNPEGDPVEEFFDKVSAKADIIQAIGESICNIMEVQCLTPRGRYDIKLYPSFLQLHGKTFDYKVPYSTVIRLFLLPHKDNRQVYFVLSVDPPIKQGQTRYHFLIILFNKDDQMNVELSLTEEELEKKYDGKLSKEMSGAEYELVSKLLKSLTAKKITVPGNFSSHHGYQCVQCSYKASNGFLYPLERGFIYVHKPPVHIRFDEIACVNFARGSGNTRSFDFDVETKTKQIYNFSSIEKEEYTKLFEFVKSKNLRVKNIGNKNTVNTMDDMLGSDNEDAHDAYLERMKAEGQEVISDGEEEESSTDEDFQPGEQSDVAEEFDSDVGSTDSEAGTGDDAKKKKPKKDKKEKRRRKPEKGSSSRTSKKKGSKKDSNAPKRPMSGYFIWLNENRQRIKDENPGIGLTDIAKKGGEMWRAITDKTEWDAKAAQAKKAYEVAMAEYKKTLTASGGDSSSSKSPSKTSEKKAVKKSIGESSGGSGGHFISKEYISDSDSSGGDEPKSKKSKKGKHEKSSKSGSKSAGKANESKSNKREKKKPEVKQEESDAESDAESEAGSLKLPSDEEILSDPTASESGSASGSESVESGSD